jgi:hypothetical protein
MTKKEMIVILAVLKEAYKDFQVTETKINLWFNLLGDLDFKIVQVAVKKLILESPYVPTISDIRKQAIEIIHPSIDATEAYGEVRRAIKEYGYDNAPEAFGSMSPLTRRVCEYIGWQNICLSEEPSIIRGQFLRMYSELREKEQKEMLLPEGLKKEMLELTENKKLALNKGG